MKLPIARPWFGERERELILYPLESGWVVQGPYVKQFEEMIAAYAGARYGVAVNSCTSGQFMLARVLGLGPGDEAIVPAFTWVSTANAIEDTGARARLVDIDFATFTLDIQSAARAVNDRTRALAPVHLFGLCADMPALMPLAHAHGLRLMEDCACGLAAAINGRHCGTWDMAGVLSFHPRKSITTGEGGMILTNDEAVARHCRALRDHGAYTTDLERHQGRGGYLLTEYRELGQNLRMTDIQGALGVAQAERIGEIVTRKRALAEQFTQRLADIAWLLPPHVPQGYEHGWQAYVCWFCPDEAQEALARRDQAAIDALHARRNAVMAALEERGIATRQGTHAVHIQRLYADRYGYAPMDFPVAYAADRLSFALPFYPQMTEAEADYLFTTLKEMRP